MFPIKFITFTLLAGASVANGTRCTNNVTKFQTFETHFGQTSDLIPAPGGGPTVIDYDWFPHCKLVIIAVTESSPPGCDEGPIGCVKISLDDYSHNERIPPYTLYGDDHGDFNFGKPDRGIHTLKACPYTDRRCIRGIGTCLEFELEVKDFFLSNFVLFDAVLANARDGRGRIGYVPYQGTMCYPPSGQGDVKAPQEQRLRHSM